MTKEEAINEAVSTCRKERMQMAELLIRLVDINRATDPVYVVTELKSHWFEIAPVVLRIGTELYNALASFVDCPMNIAAPFMLDYMKSSGLYQIMAARKIHGDRSRDHTEFEEKEHSDQKGNGNEIRRIDS